MTRRPLARYALPLTIRHVTPGPGLGGSYGIRDAAGYSVGWHYYGPEDPITRSASHSVEQEVARDTAQEVARAIEAAVRAARGG